MILLRYYRCVHIRGYMPRLRGSCGLLRVAGLFISLRTFILVWLYVTLRFVYACLRLLPTRTHCNTLRYAHCQLRLPHAFTHAARTRGWLPDTAAHIALSTGCVLPARTYTRSPRTLHLVVRSTQFCAFTVGFCRCSPVYTTAYCAHYTAPFTGWLYR